MERLELDEGSSTACSRMELVECHLEKQGESGITSAEYDLALKYYNEFTRALSRFHDLDFGGGPPTAFRMPDLPVEGMMVFMPSCEAAKGGFDVYMAVAEDHVAAFQQICHSLD